MKMIILSLVLLFSAPVVATDMGDEGISGKHIFFVSGVLRKIDDGVTIKLAHSIEYAKNEDDAINAYTRKALNDYPGYKVLTTLATSSKIPSCGTAI